MLHFCPIYTLVEHIHLYFFLQRLSNGSIDPDSDITRVLELQDTVEKQNTELTSSRTRVLELTNRCTELEESLSTTQKDLSKAQEQLVKLQRDLREVKCAILLPCCFCPYFLPFV